LQNWAKLMGLLRWTFFTRDLKVLPSMRMMEYYVIVEAVFTTLAEEKDE
jgi:hypothetical protein